MPSSNLEHLLNRLQRHPPPLLLLLLLLQGKRLLEEEADCAVVDAIISIETMARQSRHWGSHETDRDCSLSLRLRLRQDAGPLT